MNIPLVDLRAQHAAIKEELDSAIQSVISESAFIMGKYLNAFENEFAEYCGVKHGIGCSSGTTALHLALLAAEIGSGDEVITVANTFIATAEAISHCGSDPVFVDVCEDTFCIDPELVEAAISPRTKAIIAVHLYGHPAEMNRIREIALMHDLILIEDAAQAHGAEYDGVRVGGFGDLACFSFFPGKNLGSLGDAGMVVTNSDMLAEKVRYLVNHGRVDKYDHKVIGYNYRMDGLQAAVLSVKLRHLDNWLKLRRAHAKTYKMMLNDFSEMLPAERPECSHVYHLFVIRTQQRDHLQKFLRENGVATGIHYPKALHLQPAFQNKCRVTGNLSVTEKLSGEILSLPMYPELSPENIEKITSLIQAFFYEKASQNV